MGYADRRTPAVCCCRPFASSGPHAIYIDTATTNPGRFTPPSQAELR